MYTTEDQSPPFNRREMRYIDGATNRVRERLSDDLNHAVSGLGKRTKQQIVPEALIKWMERMRDRLTATAAAMGETDALLVRMMVVIYDEEIDEMKAARDLAMQRMEERKNLYRKVPLDELNLSREGSPRNAPENQHTNASR